MTTVKKRKIWIGVDASAFPTLSLRVIIGGLSYV